MMPSHTPLKRWSTCSSMVNSRRDNINSSSLCSYLLSESPTISLGFSTVLTNQRPHFHHGISSFYIFSFMEKRQDFVRVVSNNYVSCLLPATIIAFSETLAVVLTEVIKSSPKSSDSKHYSRVVLKAVIQSRSRESYGCWLAISAASASSSLRSMISGDDRCADDEVDPP